MALAFRFGPDPDDVEEEWFDDSAGLKYLAYILERPDQSIPFSEVVPDALGLKKGMAAGSFVTPSNALHADGLPMSGAKAVQQDDHNRKRLFFQQFSELRAEIDQAETDIERQELEEKLEALQKSYNSDYDKFGRPRMSLDPTEANHRKRVGNALDRFESDRLLGEQDIASLSNFSEEFKRIRYRGRGSSGITYHPSNGVSWAVSWGKDK